jgi:hypothetical protein
VEQMLAQAMAASMDEEPMPPVRAPIVHVPPLAGSGAAGFGAGAGAVGGFPTGGGRGNGFGFETAASRNYDDDLQRAIRESMAVRCPPPAAHAVSFSQIFSG